MKLLQSLQPTKKQLRIDHVFSSKNHAIYYSYHQNTLETYLTKVMALKDTTQMQYYKQHISCNMLPYLVRKQGQRSVLSIEPQLAQVVIKAVKQQSTCTDDHIKTQKLTQSNTLYINKKYIKGTNLRHMILNKDPRLDPQFCLQLMGNMLDFLLRFGGIKDYILSTQNVIISQAGQIHLNHFSFIGLDFIKLNRFVPKAQFQEILPYLTQNFMSQNDPTKRKITVEMQVRMLGINFVSALCGKDIVFDQSKLKLDVQVNWKDAQSKIKQVTNDLMKNVLDIADQQKIKQFDKQFQVRYWPLVRKVMDNSFFGQDKQNGNPWRNVMRHLCRREKQQSNISVQEVDRVAIRQLMNDSNMYDHYVSLMIRFSSVIKKSNNLNDLQEFQKKQVIQQAKRLQRQRKVNIQQSWYCKQLFIPIRTGMTFTRILMHQNWVDMLISQRQANLDNTQGVYRLLQFVISIQENIIKMQSLIDGHMIRKTLDLPKQSALWQDDRQFNKKSQFTYYHYLKQTKYPSQGYQLDTLKAQFWWLFWEVTNKLTLHCRNYLLKIGQKQLNQSVKVHLGEYRMLLACLRKTQPTMKVTFFTVAAQSQKQYSQEQQIEDQSDMEDQETSQRRPNSPLS